MSGRAGHLLAALLLIGSGCKSQRVLDDRVQMNQVVERVSLHGYFGSGDDQALVRRLIPHQGTHTPLPTYWERDVPLERFRDLHQPLYLDPTLTTGTGRDDQCRDGLGLECSTLAFYAGHGTVDRWNVPNNEVLLRDVKGGDGALRYFWLYSCNVLAHGPKIDINGDGSGDDFSRPHQFQAGDEDAFHRWRTAFGPHLRMACSGSTRLGFADVRKIWEGLFGNQRTVSHAFILGLAHLNQVPACLARGGADPSASALRDLTLTAESIKPEKPDWFHLQIPVRCTVKHKPGRPGDNPARLVECGGPDAISFDPKRAPTTSEIEALPRVKTAAMPPPIPPLAGGLPLGFVPLPGKSVKYHPDSGAVVLYKSGDRSSDQYTLTQCGATTTWPVDPLLALAGQDDLKELHRLISAGNESPRRISAETITALEMRVESRQDEAKLDQRKCWVGSLFLRYHSEIDFGTLRLPIFGPPITLEITRDENSSVASFSAPHRKLTVMAERTEDFQKIKRPDDVIREARQELKLDTERYPSGQAILGYEEAPLHCDQNFLLPTYEIHFVPTAADNHPTVIVRRDARMETDEISWECRDWND